MTHDRGVGPAPAAPRKTRASAATRGPRMLYLAPAFIVMGLITFYPARLPDVHVLHGLRSAQPARRLRAPPWVGLDNYIEHPVRANLSIPNFDFVRLLFFNLWWAFSNVVIHVILGVADRRPAQHPRASGSSGSSARSTSCRSSSRRSSWRRSGGTCSTTQYGAINEVLTIIGGIFTIPPEVVRDRLAARGQGPDPVRPAAPRLLRAADARTPGWAGRSTPWSPPGRSRASRASCTRRPRWTARSAGRSSGP